MLESLLHEQNAFVTLTYDNDHLPQGGELVPQDLTNYLKRLRKALSLQGRKIRYFACGEYGEKNNRPHYHLIIYGLAETETQIIAQCWGKGGIHVGSVTKDSLQYVCGYVLKKSLKKQTETRNILEFSRQSLRPGIGAYFPARLALLMREQNLYPITMQLCGDVPSQLRINGTMWPMGRYLKNILRREVKIDEAEVKAINREMLKQITKEALEEIEGSTEFRSQVKHFQKQLKKRRITTQEYKQVLMHLKNKTRIMTSENLSKIYNKERRLDT